MAETENDIDGIFEDAVTDEYRIKTRENLRFHNWDKLDKILPFHMDNGFILTSMGFICPHCGAPDLFGDNLRGEIRQVVGGDYRLTAYGLCDPCNTLVPIMCHYRQQEDGSVVTRQIERYDDIPAEGAKILDFKPTRKRIRQNERKKNGKEE